MDYTSSDAFVTHPATGNRMHQSSEPVTTEVAPQDLNMVIWSLMEVVKSAGMTGVPFDPEDVATYSRFRAALERKFAQGTNAVLGAEGNRTQLLAGAVRFGASGASFIEDSGHEPVGFSAVDLPTPYTYRVHFGPFSKVGAVVAVTDAELAPYGPHSGCSAATDTATFSTYAPCVLKVSGRSAVSASPLWTSQTGPITQPDATSVLIQHAGRALAVDPPGLTLLTPVAGSRHRPAYQVEYSATSTKIIALDYIKGTMISDGVSFVLSDCPNLGGVSAVWSAGLLTITHADATGHSSVELQSLDSNLRPDLKTITSNSFTVQFRDSSGNVVTPNQTAQMKFLFKRDCLVPSTMDAGASFGVDLGLCRVANTDIQNISLNNFWVYGMQHRAAD